MSSAYLFRHHELCGVAKVLGLACTGNGEQPF